MTESERNAALQSLWPQRGRRRGRGAKSLRTLRRRLCLSEGIDPAHKDDDAIIDALLELRS